MLKMLLAHKRLKEHDLYSRFQKKKEAQNHSISLLRWNNQTLLIKGAARSESGTRTKLISPFDLHLS